MEFIIFIHSLDYFIVNVKIIITLFFTGKRTWKKASCWKERKRREHCQWKIKSSSNSQSCTTIYNFIKPKAEEKERIEKEEAEERSRIANLEKLKEELSVEKSEAEKVFETMSSVLKLKDPLFPYKQRVKVCKFCYYICALVWITIFFNRLSKTRLCC